MTRQETSTQRARTALAAGAMLCAALTMTSGKALAHGDVVPQAVDTSKLTALGASWREANPVIDASVTAESLMEEDSED